MDFLRSFARKQQGLVVLRAEADKVRYVCGNADGTARPAVVSYGEAEGHADAASLARAYRGFGFGKSARCATLLSSGEYQISAVEAPDVPEAELKSAMRYRMKDVIDYPVEESVYDLLEIPAAQGAPGRSRLIYVIAAKSELVRSYVERFDEAKVPLSIIDIPETAQRNITALYESNGRAAGLLYFDDSGGLLTVTSGSELYLARRFDFTMKQIREATDAYREDLYGRILVELQRTLDNFERQNSQIVLSRILLGPQPEPTELCDYLRSNFGIDFAEVELPQVLDFRGEEPDAEAQWRFFHLIGCAIRTENQS